LTDRDEWDSNELEALASWLDTNTITLRRVFRQEGNRGAHFMRWTGSMGGRAVFVQTPSPALAKRVLAEAAMRTLIREKTGAAAEILRIHEPTATVCEEYLNAQSLYARLKPVLTAQEAAQKAAQKSGHGPEDGSSAPLDLIFESLCAVTDLLAKIPPIIAGYYHGHPGEVPAESWRIYENIMNYCDPSPENDRAFAVLAGEGKRDFIKGDSGLGNTLIDDEDRLYLIDFEEAGLGYPGQDFARLLFTSGFPLPVSVFSRWLKRYPEYANPVFISQLKLFCAFRKKESIENHRKTSADYDGIMAFLTGVSKTGS
jgi:hypothetical protein